MAAEHVGQAGDASEHQGQQEVVSQAGPAQQQCVCGFVDGKATGGNEEKSGSRLAQAIAVPAETQQMVTGKRHRKGDQPPHDVCPQRGQSGVGHAGRGNSPVDGGRTASHHDEPGHVAGLAAH